MQDLTLLAANPHNSGMVRFYWPRRPKSLTAFQTRPRPVVCSLLFTLLVLGAIFLPDCYLKRVVLTHFW